jgi:hypothetical protein
LSNELKLAPDVTLDVVIAFLVIIQVRVAGKNLAMRKTFAGGSCDSGGIAVHDAAARVKSRCSAARLTGR